MKNDDFQIGTVIGGDQCWRSLARGKIHFPDLDDGMGTAVQFAGILALQHCLKLGQAKCGITDVWAHRSRILVVKGADVDYARQFAWQGFDNIGPALRSADHLRFFSIIQHPGGVFWNAIII